MSNFAVIAAVSDALRTILWTEFNAENTVRPLVVSEQAIVFKNPTETARDSSNRLSLWLYQVTENEYVKNQPPVRARDPLQQPPAPERWFPTPMALNLYYLVTPFTATGDADHIVLGKTMQVLYDNAIVVLRDPVSEIFEELRIVFCRLTLEELTRIWEALREPYRLSICYQVRVTRLDSTRSLSQGRVLDLKSDFGNVPDRVLQAA